MSAGTAPRAVERWQGDLDQYVERAPLPIYVWERSGRTFHLAALNRAARALSGADDAETLIGISVDELFADTPDVPESMQRCADEGVEITRERRHQFANGALRDVITTYVWSPPDRVLVHVLDVTAQRAAEHRLRQSEERYRTLVQAANEGVWLVDERGVSIFANPRVTRLLGYSAEEILAGAIQDFASEADRLRIRAAIENPRDVRQPFVATFRHHDGHTLTCLVSIALVGIPDSGSARLCVLADMTALKREQDLRLDSERRYRRIVETANEGVWAVDPSGVTTLVNQRMAEMLGVDKNDLIGRPFSEFAGDSTTVAVVQRALELDGQPIRAELGMVRSNGSRLDVQVSLSALRDERGELLGGLALVLDITGLKREHEELRESQERFAQVFESAPVGIAFIGAGHLQRGRFLEINAAFRDMLGYPEDRLYDLDHGAVTHPDDLQAEHELARRVFDGEETTYSLDKRYVRCDGSTIWAQVRVSLLRDDGGRPLYLIAVVADISARKQAEELAEQAKRTTGTILEHTSDAVVEMRHDGTVAEFSSSAVRLFGYEREEAIGRDLSELIVPPALRARQREALARYLESGATRVLGARYATTAMRADGSEFPAEVTLDVVEGSDPPLFLGSVRSLAGEHALVEARQEADERFERSFRDSASGMALVGLDDRFIDVNDALCLMAGRSQAELTGRTWRDIFDSDEAAPALSWQARALAGSTEPLRARLRMIRPDGRAIRVSVVGSLVRRPGGVPVHYVHQYTPPQSLLAVARQPETGGEPLSYRERQVLTLLAKGRDGPAIADELGLAGETVRSYAQSARAKLGAATRTEAVALALVRGEITL